MATSSFSGKTLLAVASAFVAAFSLSSMDTTMKSLMADGISPYFAQGMRGILIVAGMALLVAISEKPDFRIVRPGMWMMMGRGFSMFMSSILIFIAISKIDQATVTSMIFLYPLLVGVLGTLIFREHLGPRRIIFIVLGFFGVSLAAGFTPTTFEIWALLPAIGAVFISFQAIMVRWVPKDMTNTHLSYITAVGMAICGLPFMITTVPESITWYQAGQFVMVGVLGTAGSFCLAFAFKNAPMGLVGSLNYSSIIFSTMLAWLFFAEVPPMRVFYAMAIIIAAGLGYMYFQHRAEVAIAKN